MFSGYKMVIDDPSKFHLISDDMKKNMIMGAAACANIQAALARKNAVKIARGEFIARNAFTERGITYDRCRPESAASLEDCAATVGAQERIGYMERQEFGGPRRTKSGKNLAIPTAAARGGSIRNPVQKSMYMSRLRKKLSAKSKRGKKRKAGASAAPAFFVMKGLVFMRRGRALTALYNLRMKETRTKPTRWLERACEKPAADAQSIFNSQAKKYFK